MEQPITAETLFEEFVEQIKTAVDMVETQVPNTRQQIESIDFTMVENARIYYNDVKEWRRKDTADKRGKLSRRSSQESSEISESNHGH